MTHSTTTLFGETPDGARVRAFEITDGGLCARIIEWGAVLQDLRLVGIDRPLTLGYATMDQYLADTEHIGAVVGRVANRLSGGRFTVTGRPHVAMRNIGGTDTLHGGARGWGRRLWRAVETTATRVALEIDDPDGCEGFPGGVRGRCVYEVAKDALTIALTAEAEAPTVLNLTHHAYFNLSGAATVDDHALQVIADRLTPLNGRLMPTGEVADVSGPADWRSLRPLGEAAIDVNYVLADAPQPAARAAARIAADGVEMTLETDAPGLQVYTGHNMKPGATLADGRRAGPRAGLCLEPQFWPDAPNCEGFPSIEHGPDRPFAMTMRLRFRQVRGRGATIL